MGSRYSKFIAFRTDKEVENYRDIGQFELINGQLKYLAPANSVTTFSGID